MSIQTFIHRNAWFFLGLVCLSLCVRTVVFGCYLSHDNRYWQIDSSYYHDVATSLEEGKGLSMAQGIPSFYRLPGYSLFLAAGYALTGRDTRSVLWWQIVLGSFIPLLMMLLCFILFPTYQLLARAVGVYGALHIGLVLYSGFFMTETLFIFFLLLTLILFFSAVDFFWCGKKKQNSYHRARPPFMMMLSEFCPEPVCSAPGFVAWHEERRVFFSDELEGRNRWILLAAGLLLGVVSMIRPVGLYLLVIFLVMILFSRTTVLQKMRTMVAVIFGWGVVVAPWLTRNYLLTGYLFFHTLPGGHFLYLSAARVAMHVHDISYQDARNMLTHKVDERALVLEHEKGRALFEIERCTVQEKIALHYFISYPFLSLKNWCTDMFRTLFSLYSAEILFLESGRAEVDYFAKDRGISSMVSRYLYLPSGTPSWLHLVCKTEIIFFVLLLVGFLGSCLSLLYELFVHRSVALLCAWGKILPFIALFIVISCAGGYARMRLPIEPLLAIMSLHYWIGMIQKRKIVI